MWILLTAVLGLAEPPAHGHDHGQHAEGHTGGHHGDDATVHHRFEDAEKWAKVFDDPERDAWQKPAEVVGAMGIEPGMTVADIGAGTGYFNPYLAKAVGPEGKVVAVDIEQSLVDHMAARAERDQTPQVEARLGATDDPKLQKGEVDRILLVDTYHHISDRLEYFGALRATLKPGGHLVVVDFKPGELPVGPGPGHKIPVEKVVAELQKAGWKQAASPEILEYQFVVDFVPAE